MKSLSALAFALLLAALIAAPSFARNVDRIAITAQSQKALIILKADPLSVPPGYRTAYRVNLKRYDPARQSMEGGPYSTLTFAARPSQFVDGYLIVEAQPGTYAFQDFSRQDYWALCFNDGSLQFSVGPGEVVYLGEMDVESHVEELLRMAVESRRVSVRGSQTVHFFDQVTPPTMRPVDEAGLAAVTAMMRARMPRTTVAPRPARFAPARFGTGRDLFGLSRICGGYYQGRAREQR